MEKLGGLEDAIARALVPYGFVPRAGDGWVAAWTRKTWNTNRAVVLLVVPGGVEPADWLTNERARIAADLGYLPFLYEVGMQVVLVGTAGERPIEAALDRVNNQRYLVQSIFLVDLQQRTVVSARTWGQLVTGRFQDAVASGIDQWLGRPSAPVPGVRY